MVKVSRQTVSKIARATSNEQRATTKPVMRSRTICQQCLHSLHHQIRKDLRHTPRPLASVFTQPKCSSFQSRPLFIHTRSHASVAAAAPAAPEQTSPRQDTSSHSEKQQIESNDEDELFRFYDSKASCETLFKECASQADYIVPQAFERKGKIPKTAAGEDVGEGSGWWYDSLQLMPTFNTWAQITFLHMYLLTVRFRYFAPENSQAWQQQLHDHFFWEAEHRMYIYHGLNYRSLRNRSLKEMYNQWRGVLAAYDEGLIKGDAVLGAAVWRNIFKADENVDWRDVALITSFMRRGLKALDGAKDKVILSASVKFGSPASDQAIVLKPAEGMSKALTAEDDKSLEEMLKGR